MSPVKQPCQNPRNVSECGQYHLRFNWGALEECFGDTNESSIGREEAQPVPFNKVFGWWHFLLLQVVKRSAEEKLQIVVCTPGTVDNDLWRDGRGFGVNQERLLWRKVPTPFQIARGNKVRRTPEKKCTKAWYRPPVPEAP